MKLTTHAEMLDRHIGKVGTPERDEFDRKVKTLKPTKLEKHLNKPDLPRTSLRKRSVNVWGLLVAKYVGWKVEEALLLPP